MLNDYIKTIQDFFTNGGIFMYPLALCSLLAGAAAIYKFLTLGKKRILPQKLVRAVETSIAQTAPLSQLIPISQDNPSVLGRLIDTVIQHQDKPTEQIKELIQAQARREFDYLQNGIPLLEMVINIAPMFGILGTASGLVVVFSSFGQENNQSSVAMGIAQALNTTITGLAIAAPTVVFQMYFSRKLEKYSVELESLISELVDSHTTRRNH